jgi:hypothetical protein
MYDKDTRTDPRYDEQSILNDGKVDEHEEQYQGYRRRCVEYQKTLLILN